jgi:hypothetical protein
MGGHPPPCSNFWRLSADAEPRMYTIDDLVFPCQWVGSKRIVHCCDEVATSVIGTYETCRPALILSAIWGRVEVIGLPLERRD